MRYCHFGVSPVNYSDSDSDSIIDCIKIQQYFLNDKDMYFSLICKSVGLATSHLSDKSEARFMRRGAYGEMTKLLPMKLSTNGV